MSDWRPVIALLANPDGRRVVARLILGERVAEATADLAPSKRKRVVGVIAAAGLIDGETGAFREQVFRDLLAEQPVERKRGVERFVDGTRIVQYPANAADRAELLRWVADRALAEGDVLTERDMNERLLPFSADVAALRRYLVDAGLVERRADGGAYARADPA